MMQNDDSFLMLPTQEWLHNFGLRACGLSMKDILERIGFKHCNDFDFSLQKPVCSRYGTDYFQKYFSSGGKVYNLMSTPTTLADFETKLQEKIKMLENRLVWMTTGSRRQFGLLCDKRVCIIVSMKPKNVAQHKEQVDVIKSVIEEQISKTHSFTFIRASTQIEIFSRRLLPTSRNNIRSCIEWLKNLPMVFRSNFQALRQALTFSSDLSNCPSVYLFTDGESVHGHEKNFREELLSMELTVNISCFMCTNIETFKFMKDLMKVKQGRFHSYSEIAEFDQFVLDSKGHLKKEIKSLKGIPSDLELSPDIIEMYQELEEAECNLDQIRALLVQQIGHLNKGSELEVAPRNDKDVDKEYSIRSSVWLKQCGLKARKLLLKDALAKIAFRHCDKSKGYHAPNRRPMSAKFCEKIVHLKWYDNSIVHIHITEQFYQEYYQEMMCSLALYEKRLQWLSEGSRRIFGNITESRICIAFDASLAMTENFDFFRENFKTLLYEQIKQKQRFNVAAVNSKVLIWQEQMVNTTEENLAKICQWISKLKCSGRVTLDGTLLKSLTAAEFVPAIYLILAGKPENVRLNNNFFQFLFCKHSKECILGILKLPWLVTNSIHDLKIPQKIGKGLNIPKKIRIHTISFNCEDSSTNTFLIDLATETKGRFHYFSAANDGLEYFGGEDMQLIQNEIDLAKETLKEMTNLRSECAYIRHEKYGDCDVID